MEKKHDARYWAFYRAQSAYQIRRRSYLYITIAFALIKQPCERQGLLAVIISKDEKWNGVGHVIKITRYRRSTRRTSSPLFLIRTSTDAKVRDREVPSTERAPCRRLTSHSSRSKPRAATAPLMASLLGSQVTGDRQSHSRPSPAKWSRQQQPLTIIFRVQIAAYGPACSDAFPSCKSTVAPRGGTSRSVQTPGAAST